MPSVSRIKNIVVLMMENRSFDHMLGLLDVRDLRGIGGQPDSNTDLQGRTVTQGPGAAYQGQLDPDVPHEFEDVDPAPRVPHSKSRTPVGSSGSFKEISSNGSRDVA